MTNDRSLWIDLCVKEGITIPLSHQNLLFLEGHDVIYYVQEGSVELLFFDFGHSPSLEEQRLLEIKALANQEFSAIENLGWLTYLSSYSSGGILFPKRFDSSKQVQQIIRAKGNALVYQIPINCLFEAVKGNPSFLSDLKKALKAWVSLYSSYFEPFPLSEEELLLPQKDNLLSIEKGIHLFNEHMEELFLLHRNLTLKKMKSDLELKIKSEKESLGQSYQQFEGILEFDYRHTQKHYLKGDLLLRTCQIVANPLQLQFKPERKRTFRNQMDHIHQLCSDSEIYYRVVKLTRNWWKGDSGPFLGFYGSSDQPVALMPTEKGYRMIDLENHKDQLIDQTIDDQLSLTAVMFYRTLPPQLKIVNYILSLGVRPLFFVGVLSLLVTLFTFFFPIGTDFIYSFALPYADNNFLLQITFGFLVAAIAATFFSFLRELFLIRLTVLVQHDMECGVWQRILNLPSTFISHFEIGDILLRAFTVEEIRNRLIGPFQRIWTNGIFSFFFVIPMFYFSPMLTGISVALILPILLLTVFIGLHNYRQQIPLNQLNAENQSLVLQLLNGISKIRITGSENLGFVLWSHIFQKLKSQQWHIEKTLNLAKTCIFSHMEFGILLIYVAVLLFIDLKYINEALPVGRLTAFVTAFVLFSSSLMELCLAFVTSVGVLTLWRRAKPILEHPPENSLNQIVLPELYGEISIEHVSFTYPGTNQLILDDVSLHVNAGEFIGIVGASGCGKSTLLRLLVGFEKPSGGAIYYDGHDLESLHKRHLRKQMGIVLQTNTILDGDIRDNISKGEFYSDEDIIEALNLAGFTELKKLPMGLFTLTMNGAPNFSGGQRQQMMIARSLIGKPNILIFDEATSALDNVAQGKLETNFTKLNMTRIVVAHRLSTIQNADRIYFMDKGKIVEEGTFEQLMQQKGLFYASVITQKGLGKK